ncbi:hypothetical protein HRW08_32665 [Streptomyces lunaelactis]|nr:hypothetical protein [Streptomyces lunaelactis]
MAGGLVDAPTTPRAYSWSAEMLAEVSGEKLPLPDVEETRRRLKAGQDLVGSLTVAEWLDRWPAGKWIRKSGISRYKTASACTSSRTSGNGALTGCASAT